MHARLASLLALSLCAAGALSAQAGGRITFTFAWKPGTVAEVRSVTAMGGTNPTAPADTSATIVRSTRRFLVEPHPQGLLVRTVPVSVGGEPATVAAGAASTNITSGPPSSIIVSRAGRFVGLDDTVRLKKTTDSTLQAMQPNIAGLPPGYRAAIERATSISAMTTAMQQSWQQETGQFLDRSWTIGEEVQGTMEMPFPMAPGQSIKAIVRTTVTAVAPCDDALPAVRCALVKRTVTLDPASMRQAMMGLFTSAGMDSTNPAMLSRIPETSSELVADGVLEIATLLPRRVSQRTVQNTVAAGIARRTEVTTVITYTYTSR